MEKVVFIGSRKDTRDYLSEINDFYVYIICRPNGVPFYIGKGSKYRVLEHENEAKQGVRLHQINPHKNNVFRKIWANDEEVSYVIHSLYDDENKAYAIEAQLIEIYKRVCDGGCLTNLSAGVGSSRGHAPLSKKRHQETLSGKPDTKPERATLNEYLTSIGPVNSVCIKPINEIKLNHSTPHTMSRKPTARCVYALIASASANSISLDTKAEIPRKFIYNDTVGVIENGVSRDILKAGLATLKPSKDPANEIFILNENQTKLVHAIYGTKALKDLGLVSDIGNT